MPRWSTDDKEHVKAYNSEDGVFHKKYYEIDVQTEPHCCILKMLSQRQEDYLLSLTRRFLIPIDLLKTQLGYSILHLFNENDPFYSLYPTHDSKKYLDELRKLALDAR